jgi:hypothetical protein
MRRTPCRRSAASASISPCRTRSPPNRLAAPLKAGTASDDDLRAIEARRTFRVRFTQALQLTMQKRIISPALASTERPKPPLLFKLVDALPLLQRIPGRLLAVGVRPEHIHTPDMFHCS